MGQSFVEIDWEEMEELFTRRGYVQHVPSEWQEFAFVKMNRDANLSIVVATSFDLGYYLRESGTDAIRAMLGTMVPVKLPVVTLKGVKRTKEWKTRIVTHVELLEELAEESPGCPKCNNCTIPRARRDRTGAFWGCGLYEYDGCRGSVPIPDHLARRFIAELPSPRNY